MDNDDDLSNTLLPNNFLLSTYKESISIDETRKEVSSNYTCQSCRKTYDNIILTCPVCVNNGEFCTSKHNTCSNKRRDTLLNMLNENDYEEFQQNFTDKSIHFQYCQRRFLLEKFNFNKTILQAEFERVITTSIETHGMFEQIQIRKKRFNFIHHSIKKLREQIEEKKQNNIKIEQRITETRKRIDETKNELDLMIKDVQSSREKNQSKIILFTKQVNKKLNDIRRERFVELNKYLFPIQYISTIEAGLAARIRALSNAQQSMIDDVNNDRIENDEITLIEHQRYQIVNSCLPRNGNYQIESFPLSTKTDANTPDSDSPQLSFSPDYDEILSALSHACQLINIIAFYLHIHLPFRLHQLEFNTDIPTIDYLRGNIAKLNANILSTCLSQGIPIDCANVSYTLENLSNLLMLSKFPSRPKPVMYSQEYINMIENDVNEISRTYITDYWFDDDDNDKEKDVADILNNDEWEAITEIEPIPDDPYIDEHGESISSSSSGQQSSSIMSSSFDYLKTKSSGLFNSFFRNSKS